VILTEQLELQPLSAADADDLAGLLEELVMREWLRSENVGQLRERFRRWESRSSPDGDAAWLNWTLRRREDGSAVGWVQATVRGAEAEIAYAMVPSQRRRGYALEATAAVVDWLFASAGVQSVEAHIDPANRASSALAAALGMSRTDDVHEGETVWRRRT
jgi:RimJ/RimL family protein N-acetyltransferase